VRDKIWIAPSLLSANFSCLKEEILPLEDLVDAWHIDVMDGHFVPNITLGPFIVKAIDSITTKVLDVHLMISDPIKYVDAFLDAGADFLTAHIEAFKKEEDVVEFLQRVRAQGRKVGISIKPGTDVEVLDKFLPELDLVLIMTVEPGFGGQRFIENQLPKIECIARKFEGFLAVDGGINEETARLAVEAGANFLVAGSYIFNSSHPDKVIKSLRSILS